MKWNNTLLIVTASALALIGLLFLQFKWMQQSRQLIEEQFEQKVKMALCSAVDAAWYEEKVMGNCALVEEQVKCLQLDTGLANEQGVLESSLNRAFDFYDIPGPYEVEILNNAVSTNDSPYCCSLSPLDAADDQMLSINFPGKEAYVQSRMHWMLVSSIAILLFVTTVFILASYLFWRQKRMHQINIDFFNNMAHELRTPLTNVRLASRMLQKKQPALVENKFLQIVERENQRMRDQVERVLQVAKLENGRYQLRKEEVDLVALLQEAIRDLDLQIKAKEADIIAPSNMDELKVWGDRFHLSNVFRNLLDNALKYAGPEPRISIDFQATSQGINILFEDNGIGISQAEQALIFDKYHRVGTGDLHQAKGYGLGLSYVKMIIESHQGFVKVMSELKKGSRFHLFLPHTAS